MLLNDFVLEQLRKANTPMKIGRSEVVIRCPFHGPDRNPSCHVVLENPKYRPGVFNCLSCGAHGGWNKLAEKLGLEKVTKKTLSETDPFYTQAKFFKSLNDKSVVALPKGLQAWKGEWRGLKESFLITVGAKRWWDAASEAYRILFPVYNNKILRGYVAGRLDDKTQPKYRNSAGDWVKSSWFGFDYRFIPAIREIWDRYEGSIVLTEGPYDALVCLSKGIPALALFGTNNYGDKKRSMLSSIYIENVVLFFDGDQAGRMATANVNVDLRDRFNLKKYLLPIMDNKEDQLDPGNAGPVHWKAVKEILAKWRK